MDIFKEFLESSTIHGLVYISTSKNKVLRGVWTVIVLSAFTIAFNLIRSIGSFFH